MSVSHLVDGPSEAIAGIQPERARYAAVTIVEADALQICRARQVEPVGHVAYPGPYFPICPYGGMQHDARVHDCIAVLRDTVFVDQLEVLLRGVIAVEMQRQARRL